MTILPFFFLFIFPQWIIQIHYLHLSGNCDFLYGHQHRWCEADQMAVGGVRLWAESRPSAEQIACPFRAINVSRHFHPSLPRFNQMSIAMEIVLIGLACFGVLLALGFISALTLVASTSPRIE